MALPVTGKLVRDLIPNIISDSGKNPVTCEVSGDDLLSALKLKVLEEAQELASASEHNALEEIADVLEVLLAITHQMDTSWNTIEKRAAKKRSERGGFNAGIWLLDTQ
jgi:predicted house-cleaning noncanonical NTP pyrophosphatase (MazG superfamily)